MPLSAARSAVLALALACGACARPSLPAPELPLVVSPDAPFRAQRPPLPASAAAAVVDLGFETAVLENGLSLWVATRPSAPDTSLLLVSRDGGFDSELSPELVRLTMRAVVEGGTRWADGRIVAPPLLNGRRVSFGVSPISSHLGLHVLATSTHSALSILSRTALHPAFDGLDAVKLSEMKATQQASGALSNILLDLTVAGAYGTKTADQLSGAQSSVIQHAEPATVKRYYDQLFRPRATALIAVGDITLEQLKEQIALGFGAPLASSSAPVEPPRAREMPRFSSAGRRLHLLAQNDSEQAQVLVLQPGPVASAVDDELPFALLAELAVGAVRSRANSTLRHEQGVTYGVHPSILKTRQLGLLVIQAGFEEEQAPRAIVTLLDMLEQLTAAPVKETELSLAKVALSAQLERMAHSDSALAWLGAEAYAAGTTSAQLASLPSRLAAVTPADVLRVARKYLRPRDVEIGVAGSTWLLQSLSFLGRSEFYRVDRGE